MKTFDCKKIHPKCKAHCCGIFPILKSIYDQNKHKIVRQPMQEVVHDENIVPITNNGSCVFLNEDLSCNIYDDRPDVCRKYGDESHMMMTCPYLDKDGNERSRQQQRQKYREVKGYLDKLKILK